MSGLGLTLDPVPTRLELRLHAIDVPRSGPPPHTGPAIHALVVGRFAALDPGLADRVDRQWPSPKPFCVTPLLPPSGDRPWRFQVGVFDDDLAVELLKPFASLHEVVVGRSRFVVTEGSGDEITWEELAQSARPASRWRLRFRSPTVFRASFGGEHRAWPLPAPVLVLSRLASIWDRYSPVALPTGVADLAARHLSIDRLENISTTAYMTRAPKGFVTGFTGTAEYSLAGDVPVEHRMAINSLFQLTAFAGVGDQTTKGMGWVTLERPGQR